MTRYHLNAIQDCTYEISKYITTDKYYEETAKYGVRNVLYMRKLRKATWWTIGIAVVTSIPLIVLFIMYLVWFNDFDYSWKIVLATGILILIIDLLSGGPIWLYIVYKMYRYYGVFCDLLHDKLISTDLRTYPQLIQIQVRTNTQLGLFGMSDSSQFPMYSFYWSMYACANFIDKLNEYYLATHPLIASDSKESK